MMFSRSSIRISALLSSGQTPLAFTPSIKINPSATSTSLPGVQRTFLKNNFRKDDRAFTSTSLRMAYDIPESTKRLVLVAPAADQQYDKYEFGLETVPVPTLEEGQVLIKMEAAAVNPSDYQGWEFVDPATCPLPIGNEGSGIIVATKGECRGRKLGDKVGVFGAVKNKGVYQEYVAVDAMKECYSMPDDVAVEDAASFFINPFTSLALLDYCKWEGSKVAIHTLAASSLGQMMIRVAPKKGMTLINMVRRKEQVGMIKEMGAENIICTADPDWKDQLAAKCEELDCKVAIEAIGGEMPGILLDIMPHGTTCVVYGALEGLINKINPRRLIYEDKKMIGFYLRNWIYKGGPEEMIPRMTEATKLVMSGLAPGGWSSSKFTDISLDTFREDFVAHTSAKTKEKKMRIRF